MRIEESKIKLGNGFEIVAEKYGVDGEEELTISLLSDGTFWQDICLVRPFEDDKTKIDLLVWADGDDEGYSNRFIISPYEE